MPIYPFSNTATELTEIDARKCQVVNDCKLVSTELALEAPSELSRATSFSQPLLSRNRWVRPDLARVMNTESEYAPYVTPRRQSPSAN